MISSISTSTTNVSLPRLAITMGDVNGIGPEILAKALARPEVFSWCRPLIFGDATAYEWGRQFAPDAPAATAVGSLEEALSTAGLSVWHATYPAPQVSPGSADPKSGAAAVEWIKAATQASIDKHLDGLVTCPISKAVIYGAGYHYIGHTELVAEMCGVDEFRMCLFAGPYRLIHITGHLSLREALDRVKRERIENSIRIANVALRRMGFNPPRIAVAGLNPHAGEGGAFGREEIEEITPAIEACRAEGIECDGPHPPDTILAKLRDGRYDALIAMYHDQGHIPIKLVAMDEGVNVTLGIPIVRTSVDHGTAFDIAGKGIAREDSLCSAIKFAAQLTGKLTL